MLNSIYQIDRAGGILFLIVVSIGITDLLHAQSYTAQAVMEVRAEVVSASHFENTMNGNLGTDISRAIGLHQAGELNEEGLFRENEAIEIGEFSLLIPDGVEYTKSVEHQIVMNNGSERWWLETNVELLEVNENMKTYRTTGQLESTEIPDGTYEGVQVITVEYY